MPLLSLVIPNYNYGRFADRLFGSIAAQTFPLDQVEILFVDDGSDDDSIVQATTWAETLPCYDFRILTPERSGKPGLVRNHGLNEARGEFLQCFDPDDTLLSEFLETCINVLLTHPSIDIVYTDYLERTGDTMREVALPKFTNGLLRMQNGVAQTVVMRRTIWERGVRYRSNTEYEDWDFWIQCQMVGASFYHEQSPLYIYEQHEANFSHHARSRDGHAKAQIVLNNPEFFHREVVRWAESFLRGRLHGQAMQRGYIPTPADVRKLLADVERRVLDLGRSED